MKTPPFSHEAEMAVLGGALLNPDALQVQIPAEAFYHTGNQIIHRAMVELDGRIDSVALIDRLRAQGLLEACGGAMYIAELTGQVPTLDNVEHHAKVVLHLWRLRKIISAAHTVKEKAYQASSLPSELVSDFETLSGVEEMAGETHSVNAATKAAMQSIERLYTGEDKFISTGFDSIDRSCPFAPSDFVVFAARSAMGKTSFMLDLAYNVAKDGGGVLIVSMEMRAEQIMRRMMAQVGRVDAFKIRTGKLDSEDFVKLSAAHTRLHGLNIEIIDASGVSVPEIRATVKRMKRKRGVSLVCLDYLQKLALNNRRAKELRHKVMDTAAAAKNTAKDFEVVFFALAQINRDVDKRPDTKPHISDISESKDIENEADSIGLLYRAEHYLKDKTPIDMVGLAEIEWAKSRHGPQAWTKLRWDGRYTSFSEWEWRHDV